MSRNTIILSQNLHDQTQATALSWFNNHNQQMKEGILSHYGELCGSHSHHDWHIHSQNIIESATSLKLSPCQVLCQR